MRNAIYLQSNLTVQFIPSMSMLSPILRNTQSCGKTTCSCPNEHQISLGSKVTHQIITFSLSSYLPLSQTLRFWTPTVGRWIARAWDSNPTNQPGLKFSLEAKNPFQKDLPIPEDPCISYILPRWMVDFMVNVDKYTSPMDPMGMVSSSTPRINLKTLVGADLPVNQHSPEMKWVKYPVTKSLIPTSWDIKAAISTTLWVNDWSNFTKKVSMYWTSGTFKTSIFQKIFLNKSMKKPWSFPQPSTLAPQLAGAPGTALGLRWWTHPPFAGRIFLLNENSEKRWERKQQNKLDWLEKS